MKINDKHPKYLDFLKNELKTLNYIQTIFSVSFKDISVSAKNIASKYQNLKDKVLKSQAFEFHSNFQMTVEKEIRKIVIEAKVTPDFQMVTYYFAICKTHEDNTLLRKFHYDYATQPYNSLSPKPVYHIQYGGEKSPYLAELQIEVENLNPWLSSPRLSATPINLALFLDLILVEFSTEETYKIISKPEWKNFIKTNEEFILKPYYENVNSFLHSTFSSNFLIRDFYYGLD